MKKMKIDQYSPDPTVVFEAYRTLLTGGIIVYPTDTAYGIGVNAMDVRAISKLYDIKGRDYKKPTHVVVKDWEMIEKIAETDELAKKLYEQFMPGALTLVLSKKAAIPSVLTAQLPTVGVRIPNSAFTKALSRLFPQPYTTPSANRSGEATPYSIDRVTSVLDVSRVDLIIDAGDLPQTPPSTIIDLTTIPASIIREGAISKDRLLSYI